MDGKGRFRDNILIERLWRSLKYEEVYIKAYASTAEAKSGIGAYIFHYNTDRPHQSLGNRTPCEVFEAGAGLWICGQSAAPNGSASPMFPPTIVAAASSGQENMGKGSPLPASPQAQPKQESIRLNSSKQTLPLSNVHPETRVINAQEPGGILS